MDKYIKKKLTRNWFINLQEMICNTIQEIEGGKIKFFKKSWKRNIKRMKEVAVIIFLKTGKYLTKLVSTFQKFMEN